MLEGVCASLDEEFDFTYEAYLYVLREEHGQDAIADAIEMIPDSVMERVGEENLYRMKKRIEPLAEFLRELSQDE